MPQSKPDPAMIAKGAMAMGVCLKIVAAVVGLMGAFVLDPDWKRFDYMFALVAYIGGSLHSVIVDILRSENDG